ADFEAVLPGYFETLRTPLIAGRTFTDADNSPDRKLVVIDQLLAAKAFPKESAIGKRIFIRVRGAEAEPVEVIGVVCHQREASLAVEGREEVFVSDGYIGHGAAGRWAVRTAGDPANYAGAIRAEVKKIDPKLAVFWVQPQEACV